MPVQLTEAAFLLKVQWTPQQYDDAPDELVEQMILLLNAEAEAARMKNTE